MGLVIVSVSINSSLVTLLKVFSVTNFLSFGLVIHLRVVLGVRRIECCTEPYNRFRSKVANVHPNKHRMLVLHLRKCHMIQISACLCIDLFQEF